jgi:Zn-dependent metalloprotease
MQKHYFIYLLILLLPLCFFSCDKDNDTDPFYPTLVGAKSDDEIQGLYNQVKKNRIYNCTLLDDFGHFRLNLKDKTSCVYNTTGKASYSDLQLDSMVKATLSDLNTFYEIDNASQLNVDLIRTLKGESYETFRTAYPDSFPPVWKIVYQPQIMNNLVVRGTIIEAFVDSAGVFAVSGNWFRNIYFPAEDKIDAEKAKSSLLNRKLTYKTYTLSINNETQWRSADRVVVPVYRSGKIEIRICHALYTGNWEIIVDSQSGEVLSTVNLDAV